MKPKSTLRHLFFASTVLVTVNSASAIDYYWNQNSTAAGWGTGGAWSTSSAVFTASPEAPLGTAVTATTGTGDTLFIGSATTGFAGGTLTIGNATTQFIGSIITGSANNTAGVNINPAGAPASGILSFAASGIITNNSSQGLVVGTAITGAGTRLDLNANGGDITMSGAGNTYTGITYVNSGTVTSNNAGSLGTSGADSNRTVIASGARLNFNNTPRTYTERFEIAGAGVGGTSGALNNGQTTTLNGSITLSGAATIANSATLTIGGGIALGGNALTFLSGGTTTVQTNGITNGSVIKSGAGTVNLNIASSYAGGTTLSAGTLAIGAAISGSNSAIGSTSGQLTVNGGTLNMAANNVTVGNLTGAGGIISGTSGTRLLTIGQGDTGGGNFLGAINNGTGGTTALTKTGNGTIKLGSTSGYTGATAVSGGTLVVNGNISTSGSTTVSNGATLAGIGTVGTTTIQTTGIFAPGDSGIESLNTGALTLDSGSISNFEINTLGDISDLAISSALLTFGGTLNVSNIGGTLITGDTFNLFDWGSTTGAFSTVNLPTLTGGLSWNQSNLYTAGTIAVIPEPRAALLGGLGMLALLRRRR